MGIWISKSQAGLYAWIFIFPISSYLLLGRRLGIVLTAVSVFLGLGALGWRVWQQDMDVHWIILGNFWLCAFAIWAMAHVYEVKRETVVQAKDIYTRRIASEIHKLDQELSLSVGYVQADPNYELSPEELIQQADQKMYDAKRAEN